MNLITVKHFSYLFLFLCLQCKPTAEKCNDKYQFINCSDSFPVIKFPLDQHSDSLYFKLKKLYNDCDTLRDYHFRLPIEIDKQKGFINIITYLSNNHYIICGIKHELHILLNNQNQLLVGNSWSDFDSLKKILALKFRGNEGTYQDSNLHQYLRISLKWDNETNPKVIHNIIRTITETHYQFVEERLSKENEKFCALKKYNIEKIKENYPLRIVFSFHQNTVILPEPEKK
jgi:hypothetical protein